MTAEERALAERLDSIGSEIGEITRMVYQALADVEAIRPSTR